MNTYQILINTIIISIPEEFFVTMLILFLLGRSDYFNKRKFKKNMPKIIIFSVLPIAIISNVILLQFNIPDGINLLINFILYSISAIILNKPKKVKQYIMTIVLSCSGILIFMIIEMITVIIITYGFHMSISQFNKSPFINFIAVIPERIIEYGFLTFIFIKVNSLKPNINVFKLIFKNKFLLLI